MWLFVVAGDLKDLLVSSSKLLALTQLNPQILKRNFCQNKICSALLEGGEDLDFEALILISDTLL